MEDQAVEMAADSVIRQYVKPMLYVKTDEELLDVLKFLEAPVILVLCGVAALWPAAYGRYSGSWPGPSLPLTASWLIHESPSVLLPLWLLFNMASGRDLPTPNLVLLLYFAGFNAYRTYVHPFLMRSTKPSSAVLVLAALVVAIWNGFYHGFTLIEVARYSDDWMNSCRFLVGSSVFLVSMMSNIWHDQTLRGLRKNGETVYKIPHGGLFQLVSCPNYLSEIIGWWGFALASSIEPAVLAAIFTTFFLGSRAYYHHRFYLKKFEDYPKRRRIIIPYLL